MFNDLLDMTVTYIQYITLLLRLDPQDVPDFYTEPFKVLRYVVLDIFNQVGENQRYNNSLRVKLPDWLPLDIRLQFVCIAVIGPMVVTTLGMLYVYGKPVYIWFVCVLGTLFMLLFGFILLANLSSFAVPGAALPSRTALSVLGGVGLPCFLLLLAGGLLWMGRARLQRLQRDAAEMEDLVEEERQRRRDQRVTQQMVDREGIDLVAVAAEQVHARREKEAIEHIDWGDVLLQGLFVIVLFIGSLILLDAIKIRAIADMQRGKVFKVLGIIAMVLWGCVTFWWILELFKKGRQLQKKISNAVSRRGLSLVVMVSSTLYINVVTNFISIMYCVTLKCEAGTRTPFSASLFPSLVEGAPAEVLTGSAVGCVSCDYHAYPQRCSADWQRQLCTTAVQQRRLVYDPRVECADIDAFYKASGSLIFVVYLVFLPYLQFYMAQYAVQVLKESYPLERRYYDVFTPEEIYFQKVLSSKNNAAFAYRAYKPEFRFYRLSFLLQKVILGVVGCVMRKGLSHDVSWAGMIFFLVVPLIALSCSLYLQPFSRQVEAYYFVAVQAMVSVCAVVCLIAQQIRAVGMPTGIWIVLMVLLIVVPVCTLVVGNAVTLQEERRWKELWQQRLVESVTAAYSNPAQRQNPLLPPQQQKYWRQQQQLLLGYDECVTGVVDNHGSQSYSSSSTSGSSGTSIQSSSTTTSGSSSGGDSRHAEEETSLPMQQRRLRGQREEEEEEKEAEGMLSEDEFYTSETLKICPFTNFYAEAPVASLRQESRPGMRRRRSHNNDQMNVSEASVLLLPGAAGSALQPPHRSSSSPRAHTPRAAATRHHHHHCHQQHHSHHSSRLRSDERPEEGIEQEDPTTTLRAGTVTTRAITNLRKLRVLPGLMQADTWGDSLKTVLGLAGRTIVAPFSHFHRHSVVEDSFSSDVPARVRNSTGEDSRSSLPLGSSPTSMSTTISSERNEDQSTRSDERRGEEVPMEMETADRDDVYWDDAVSPECKVTPPPVVRTTTPRQRRAGPGVFSGSHVDPHPSHQQHQQQHRQAQSVSTTDYSLSSVNSSGAVITPSRQACSSSALSISVSLTQQFNTLPVPNLLSGDPLNQRVSASLSPSTSTVSPAVSQRLGNGHAVTTAPAMAAAAAVVAVAAEAETSNTPTSPSSTNFYLTYNLYTRSTTSTTSTTSTSSAHAQQTRAAAASTVEDAGEYVEDATETFVPSLYFTTQARPRWRLSRRAHAGGSINSLSAQRGSAESGGRLAHRPHGSVVTAHEVDMGAVQLPWKRCATQPSDAPRNKSPLADPRPKRVSPAAAENTDAATPSSSSYSSHRPHTRSTSSSVANNNAPRTPVAKAFASVKAACRTAWRWFCSVDDDAAKRRRYVLNFTDVYVRRQLCAKVWEVERQQEEEAATTTADDGDDGDVGNADALVLTPAQLRRCARRAFWGNPTDAMLGVVEVPGSMPAWGLYCDAPLPPRFSMAPAHDDGQTPFSSPQHRSMFSLQRQYYAQLAEEQQWQSGLRMRESHHCHPDTALRRSQPGGVYNGDGEQQNSLTNSPVHTSLSQFTGFRFPLPMHPLRAAAYERHAAAIRAYPHSRAEKLLPLDTELDTYAALAREDVRSEDGMESGEGAGEVMSGGADVSRSGTSAGQRRESGTLHWLQQWGPVLTELLYEAAMDDNRRATIGKWDDAAEEQEEEESKLMSSDSESGGNSSSPSFPSSSADSSSSTVTAHHRSGRGAATRSGRSKKSKRKWPASSAWWRRWSPRLLWTRHKANASRTRKRNKRDTGSPEDRAAAAAAAAPTMTASPDLESPSPLSGFTRSQSKRGELSGSPGLSTAAPSLNGDPQPLQRQRSMLLTLITGTQAAVAAAAAAASSSHALLLRHDGNNNNNEAAKSVATEEISSNSSPHQESSSHHLRGRGRRIPEGPFMQPASHHSNNGSNYDDHMPEYQLDASAMTMPPVPACDEGKAEDWNEQQQQQQQQQQQGCAGGAAASPAAPQDPLIQQLRCLHLVRERLKESYWEHRNQLTAVQHYINYEINETVRRVLVFLFLVVGITATLSFTLAILGMLRTLNWRFISGVQRSEDDLRYELAGYNSWDEFTSNCCCMAATHLPPKYPYYAFDVENWICANGVTKERVRRDGYDGETQDGYTVRTLCGMTFQNNCGLTIDTVAKTVTLTGCNTTEVTSASMLRW